MFHSCRNIQSKSKHWLSLQQSHSYPGHIPGNGQGQLGWGLEQPGAVEGVDGWVGWSVRSKLFHGPVKMQAAAWAAQHYCTGILASSLQQTHFLSLLQVREYHPIYNVLEMEGVLSSPFWAGDYSFGEDTMKEPWGCPGQAKLWWLCHENREAFITTAPKSTGSKSNSELHCCLHPVCSWDDAEPQLWLG